MGKNLLLCLVAIMLSTSLFSQKKNATLAPGHNHNHDHSKCMTSEKTEEMRESSLQYSIDERNLEEFTRNFIRNNKSSNRAPGDPTEPVVIPVVFHVYGEIQNGYSVTYSKIANHLAELNKDFNGTNSDFNLVDPAFQSLRAKMNIQFKFAKIDPWGGASSGVVFYPKNKNGYGETYLDNVIAKDAWDNKKYFNIYIQPELYDDARKFNSGVGWYPNQDMTNRNVARIVFNGRYFFGNDPSNSATDFGATLTHEFGHWLNLIHTFENKCEGTDEVADTPQEDGNHSIGCTAGGGSNCGAKINHENYMGYNGSSGCYRMYTKGQQARMAAALASTPRSTIWASSNITATGVNLGGSTLALEKSIFMEGASNDGSFGGYAPAITLAGSKTFALSSGTLVNGTHYTSSFPAGLTPVLTVNNNKTVTLTVSGRASSHAEANSNARGTITFNAAAFSGGLTDINARSINVIFKFRDPYKIHYVDISDNVISTATPFARRITVELADVPEDFAPFYFPSESAFKMDVIGKRMVCNSGTLNATLIAEGATIGSSSNFVAQTSTQNDASGPVLRSASYTAWDGRTGYLGFEIKIFGDVCYGWMKASYVGGTFTVFDYAINTQPGASIKAGDKTGGSVVVVPPTGTVVSPSGTTATANNDLSITVRWTDNSSAETFNIVQRAVGTSTTFTDVASLGANVTSFVNTGLTAGTTYKYRVRAASSTQSSGWSNEASATATSGTTPPTTTLPAPTGLRADVYSTAFYAVWGTVTGATGYDVEVKYGTTTTVNDVPGGSSYFFYVRKVGTTLSYSFRVRAKNASGVGPWSSTFNVNLPAAGPTGEISSKGEKLFNIFPNPTSDAVYFAFKNNDPESYEVSLYSTDGKLVDKIYGLASYNVSTLNKGLYIVIAQDKEGNRESAKLLVE